MLAEAFLEPANTKRSLPIVIALTKNGSFCFCADYRKLNAITVCKSLRILQMNTCIDALGHAKVPVARDANAGYLQIEMEKEAKNKSSFVKHDGLFRYEQMPFEPKNALATLYCAMDVFPFTMKWEYLLVKLEEVAVFSQWLSQHVEQVATA